MISCFFISDLHGKIERYQKLFKRIETEKPQAVFLGGDLLPSGLKSLTSEFESNEDFINEVLITGFLNLKNTLGSEFPRVFLILGNDDGKAEESVFIEAQKKGIWEYIHNKKTNIKSYNIYGYSYVPPTPFLLKDWERYDVSRYVDPGCVPPEEGYRSVPEKKDDIVYSSIQEDLKKLVLEDDLSKALFLFHTPPYKTNLDRAALDGKMIDHVPLDVHVGSIAVQRFLESNKPLVSLHGHVHESARITGFWEDKIGSTFLFSAAHDGPELSLVRFDLANPEVHSRELI